MSDLTEGNYIKNFARSVWSGDYMAVCTLCGAALVDKLEWRRNHTEWHESLDKIAKEAGYAYGRTSVIG